MLELRALGPHAHQLLPAAAWTARPSSLFTKTEGYLAVLSLESSWHSKGKQAAMYHSVHGLKTVCSETELSAQDSTAMPPTDGCCTLVEKCTQLSVKRKVWDDTRKGHFSLVSQRHSPAFSLGERTSQFHFPHGEPGNQRLRLVHCWN